MFKRNVEQSFPRDLDLKITVKTSVSCGEVNHLQMVDFLFSNFFQVEGDVPGQKKKDGRKNLLVMCHVLDSGSSPTKNPWH